MDFTEMQLLCRQCLIFFFITYKSQMLRIHLMIFRTDKQLNCPKYNLDLSCSAAWHLLHCCENCAEVNNANSTYISLSHITLVTMPKLSKHSVLCLLTGKFVRSGLQSPVVRSCMCIQYSMYYKHTAVITRMLGS